MNEKSNKSVAPESEIKVDKLAETIFSELPDTFALRNDDNSIIQEHEPCYICRADGFYGAGTQGTWYAEGSIIVTHAVPNEHMEPLNRGAALNYVRWIEKLPNHRAPIDVGDMSEAAQMLAKDPKWQELTPVQAQQAVIELAVGLKLRREGREARELPPIGHNFTRGPNKTAPPILGARMSDMGQRFPGETRLAAAIPQVPQGPITRRAAVAPMGGVPAR